VAEELGFKQRFRNRRAVDGDKGLAASRRKPVQGLGHQFLARAGRPFDQHRRHARGHQADAAADLEHAGSVADQLRQPLAVRSAPAPLRCPSGLDGMVLPGPAGRERPPASRLGAGAGRAAGDGWSRPGEWLRKLRLAPAPNPVLSAGRRVPRRRVGVLAAAQGIEQLLAIGSARALLSGNIAPAVTRSTWGKRSRKSLRNSARSRSGSQESTMTASGARPQPRPGLGAAFGLAHLPAQAGKSLSESRWRKLRSALATSAVRGRMRGRREEEPEQAA
jgi:hypothetical protein